MLLFISNNTILQQSNIIDTQRFLCGIQCGQMRNGCVENLIAVLSAAAKFFAEPRNTTALRFQIGLNLVSYVYIHKKGVNYSLKSLPCPQVPPSNPNQ